MFMIYTYNICSYIYVHVYDKCHHIYTFSMCTQTHFMWVFHICFKPLSSYIQISNDIFM